MQLLFFNFLSMFCHEMHVEKLRCLWPSQFNICTRRVESEFVCECFFFGFSYINDWGHDFFRARIAASMRFSIGKTDNSMCAALARSYGSLNMYVSFFFLFVRLLITSSPAVIEIIIFVKYINVRCAVVYLCLKF